MAFWAPTKEPPDISLEPRYKLKKCRAIEESWAQKARYAGRLRPGRKAGLWGFGGGPGTWNLETWTREFVTWTPEIWDLDLGAYASWHLGSGTWILEFGTWHLQFGGVGLLLGHCKGL